MLSTLYAAAARRRRERYAARPDLRRRLRRPVISVGNLAVGGRGKTPIVAAIVRELLAMGERPAVLSRGYARTHAADGVVVVRDPMGIRSDLARSGDEPLMLARQLSGASVLVCPDRYLAGCLAERRLDATIHVLDDGFQHLQLDRDIDILIVGRDDIARPMTLPGGRLREPLDTCIVADAIIAADDDVEVDVRGLDIPIFRVMRAVGAPIFANWKRVAPPRPGSDPGRPFTHSPPPGSDPGRSVTHMTRAGGGLEPPFSVAALAGIASPARFFDDLRRAGYSVVETLAYADHHSYGTRDVRQIFERAATAGAAAVLTTEKDFVRLLPHRPFSMPVGWVPLTMVPAPLPEFRRWLAESIAAARDMVPSSESRVRPPDSQRPNPKPRVSTPGRGAPTVG